MARKKKLNFKLEPDWMLKEPIDFEYNKYTLLNFIQKCQLGFDKLELYPDFVELSLHLANLQTLSTDKKIFVTDKKFESCDDEILLKDLVAQSLRELSEEEQTELEKTIMYSGNKLFDTFNMAKSIWNLAFDNVEVTVRRNKTEINSGYGFIFYWKKEDSKLFVWEYKVKKNKSYLQGSKLQMNLIFEGDISHLPLMEIINNNSTFNKNIMNKELPIFEVKSTNPFPMEQTLIPMIKRKVLSLYFQIVTFEKTVNIDLLP